MRDLFAHLGVADIAMESIIPDALKAFWQDVLNHTMDKVQSRERCVLDIGSAVIAIPVTNGVAIVTLDASDRDGRRDNIFGKVLSQSLSTERHLTLLNVSHKAFWVLLPCAVDVVFDVRVRDALTQHREQIILPLAVDHLKGDV